MLTTAEDVVEHPPSLNQRSMLFVQQLAPESSAYNLGLAYRLHGDLGPDLIRGALRSLGRRHAELCARVLEGAGGASIRSDRDLAEALVVEAPIEREALDQRMAELFRRPLALAEGVLRVHLIPIAADELGLMLVVHHAAADGTSLVLVERDLSELLCAAREGRAPSLPDPGAPYARFVAWQAAFLSSDAGRDMLEGAAGHLGGCGEGLELPLAERRPAIPTYTGGAVDIELPLDQARAARGSARAMGVTTYRVLLAAFFAVMHRLTGQTDLTIGTFVRGRPTPDFDETCGDFVNSVPLRLQLDAEASFRDLVRATDAELERAFSAQHVPFLALADRVAPRRSADRNPVFNVMFGVQREAAPLLAMERTAVTFAGLAGERVPLGYNEGAMDLLLACHYLGDRILCSFKYSADLFATRLPVERMATHFLRILAAALADPDAPIAGLSMLTAAELAELLPPIVEPAPGPWSPVHAQISAQAETRPDAVAVACGNETLTYAALEQRSNQLARRLSARGVGPGDLVALHLGRSVAFFIGLLGILKAGAAYVPLDPAFPEDRLIFMLADSGARILVTDAAGPAALCDAVAGVVRVDDPTLQEEPQAALGVSVRPSGLVYVIYTSGTTGRPKGVEITHGALTHLIQAMRREFSVRPGDVMFSVAPFSFDLSVPDLFLPLTSGAQVRVALPSERSDGAAFRRCLEVHGVTLLAATPSTWQLLIAAGWEGTPGLRVMCGGEAMSLELARALSARSPAVWNLYGPTEATVWTTIWRVEPGAVRVELGRPIDAMRVVLLDRAGEPVPAGVVGELCIGGPGLARGYLGREALTAERFIADRVTPGAGPEERLYRTGDLARRRLDGSLEYLGRLDHQVKVRGYRIELGEIEAALEAAPAVRSAVVLAREDRPGDVRLVAYVQPQHEVATLEVATLRRALGERLPDYMIPAHVVVLRELPLSRNGKVDRAQLPPPEVEVGHAVAPPRSAVERVIAEIWGDVLGRSQVGLHDNFFDLGGHSLLVAEVVRRLAARFDRPVPMVAMFRNPTVEALARSLDELDPGTGVGHEVQGRPEPPRPRGDAVAIVGWSGRFPGASSVDALWRALCDGEELISRLSREELLRSGVSPSLLGNPDYVAAKGVLADGDCFDAAFFGYSPREAEAMDPQQRVFLECAWSAMEAAGYDPGRLRARVGVYGGAGSHYFSDRPPDHPRSDDPAERYLTIAGNTHDFLTARVSYELGLTGPSVNVQTACSSSLVAVHMACAALQRGECEMALAGGVCVTWPIKGGYLYQAGGTMSSDGACRPFDASAEGMLLGNGVAIVVLKSLERALADGDTIHAVVRGTAINNDGDDKIGFTAPSVSGQRDAIRGALAAAGLHPKDIGYVEAHGTGTRLGDPIEAAALGEALGARPGRPRYLGAVKANVGHLDAAAGVTGLIKAALVVRDGVIPPIATFRAPNPEVDLAASGLVVPLERRFWEDEGEPRRAGVTSLGLGGTNAHAIVEAPPKLPERDHDGSAEIVVVSAKTEAALQRSCEALATHLAADPGAHLGDVCFTLQEGREPMVWRRAVVARDTGEAASALKARRPGSVQSPSQRPPLVFLFPGVGCQYAGMGRELHEAEPVYREVMDRCIAAFAREGVAELRALLFPAEGECATADEELRSPRVHMPAIFAVEYALGRLLLSWGLRPDAMIGLSLGEITAAALGGALVFEDAIRLVARRGALCAEHGSGAMLVVQRSAGEMEARLSPPLAVAVETAPHICVISGPERDIQALEASLVGDGVRTIRLPVGAALHSPLLEPVVEPIRRLAAGFASSAPVIPFYSGVTGALITVADLEDPGYWARHVRDRVRADDVWRTLFRDRPGAALLQVGPGHAMVASARIHPASTSIRCTSTTMPASLDGGDARRALLQGVAELWTHGIAPDWHALRGGRSGRRVPLPTYPFARVSIPRRGDPGRAPTGAARAAATSVAPPSPVWEPTWRQASTPTPLEAAASEVWWLFSDQGRFADAMTTRAIAAGHVVIHVEPGEGFRELGARSFSIRPEQPEDYHALLDAAMFLYGTPDRIIHAWGLCGAEGAQEDDAPLVARTGLGVTLLVQALSAQSGLGSLSILAVAQGMLSVFDREPTRPACATLLGAAQSLTMECAAISCRCVDLPVDVDPVAAVEGIWREVHRMEDEPVVALRGGRPWIQEFAPVSLTSAAPAPLRERGVVFVTGGLGGLGLTIAAHLARRSRARIVLFGRTGLPPRAQWASWRQGHGEDDRTSQRIAAVEALEAAGAEVLIVAGDASSRADVERGLSAARERFGAIHAIFHAAGVLASAPLPEVSPEGFAQAWRPKLQGLKVLAELTRGDRLDWFVACSSTSGVLGGMRLTAYAAANAALDAAAGAVADRLRILAWGPLRMGMALRAGGMLEGGARGRSALEGDEVVSLFERCLAGAQPILWIDPEGQLAERRRLVRHLDLSLTSGAATSSDATDDASGPPAHALEGLWREVLGVSSVAPGDDFFALGGTSLLAIQLLSRLRERFGVRRVMTDLLESPTFEGFSRLIGPTRDRVAGDARVLRFQSGRDGQAPLFLLPPATGSLLYYPSLVSRLPTALPVLGLRLPGADGARPLLDDREALLDHFAEVLEAAWPRGPVRLLGHSMGGIFSYLLAQRLRQGGRDVELVALLDTPGPGEMDLDLTTEARIRAYMRESSEEMLAVVDEAVAAARSAGPGISDEYQIFATYAANITMMRGYTVQPYRGRGLYLRAQTRDRVNAARPEAQWIDLFAGGLEVHVVPGNHVTLLAEPHVEAIARVITQAIYSGGSGR